MFALQVMSTMANRFRQAGADVAVDAGFPVEVGIRCPATQIVTVEDMDGQGPDRQECTRQGPAPALASAALRKRRPVPHAPVPGNSRSGSEGSNTTVPPCFRCVYHLSAPCCGPENPT